MIIGPSSWIDRSLASTRASRPLPAVICASTSARPELGLDADGALLSTWPGGAYSTSPPAELAELSARDRAAGLRGRAPGAGRSRP